MPQLLVREIEASVVKKLRRRAAAQGISMEEAHRQLLRSALAGNQAAPQEDFLAYLRSIPPDKASDFPRAKDKPRKVDL
jgi:plasmid stability protein